METHQEPVDRFDVFVETCRALGVSGGAKRIEVLLRLPERETTAVLEDTARHLPPATHTPTTDEPPTRGTS